MKTCVSKLCCLVFLATLAHGTCGSCHDGHEHPVPKVQAAEMYRPTAMPDRIVLTWTGDPRTTQAVTWRTSTEVPVGKAEIAVASANPNFTQDARQVVANTQVLQTDINSAHFHTVEFTGLTPGTVYAYRVGDGTNWSEWFHFRTADDQPRPFSFIYFGDAQNNIRSMWSRVIREAHRDAPTAAFIIHAGDLINRAEADAEWGEWFGAGGWLNAMIPSVAVPGNHEYQKHLLGPRTLSQHWRPTFAFPQHGPPGTEETCYTLVYHNLRIICLNSNELLEEQASWMEQVLAENDSPWVVCTFHHPIFSAAKDRDNPHLRALWKPIFDKYRVDLVLQGHDHTYARTGFDVPGIREKDQDTSAEAGVTADSAADKNKEPLRLETVANVATGVQTIDAQAGTVYVVSVSGPKMYNNQRLPYMRRIAEDTQLYQIIHVDGDTLRFEARTAIGQLYDAFELHKQDGTINRLVEIDVDTPPQLRTTTSSR
ncbi:MAG: phosphoesterase [Pirellulaceae bacterium]|nr:MAG: phosphoesterase [Pirellulaceae bacterium]